jgi:hypothetical protein
MKAKPDLDKFQFRNLHPKVLVGTASDRYAVWIGQIYTEERYVNRISKRAKTGAGKTVQEQVLPVDSVEEYFQHFPAPGFSKWEAVSARGAQCGETRVCGSSCVAKTPLPGSKLPERVPMRSNEFSLDHGNRLCRLESTSFLGLVALQT